jgi:hypothetical protein
MKMLKPFILMLALAACSAAQDRPVALRLTNGGEEPLRCRIVFGHWVERDLAELVPGGTHDIVLMQSAKDRALYIDRYDNQRQMMIENIVCGRIADWRDTTGQIDLTHARQQMIAHIEATCAAPREAGRVACHVTGLGS